MPWLSNRSLKLPVGMANITVHYCLPGKCFPAYFTGCFGCMEIVRSRPLSFDRLDPETWYSPHFTGLGDTWETWSAALNMWSTPKHKRLDLSCFADCSDYCWGTAISCNYDCWFFFCFFFYSSTTFAMLCSQRGDAPPTTGNFTSTFRRWKSPICLH